VVSAEPLKRILSPTNAARRLRPRYRRERPANTNRATVDDQSWVKGDSQYLGTELELGLTWRFAPNTAFDLQGGYLFAGSALNTAELLNGVHTRRDANDAYLVSARVRLAF